LLELNKGPEFDAGEMERFQTDWFKREACPWDFNQIAGWIRLYARSRNIRVFGFSVDSRISIEYGAQTFVY
jgi:hypothetical protein